MLKSGMQINTNKFSFSEIVSLCYSKFVVCYSEVGLPVGLYVFRKIEFTLIFFIHIGLKSKNLGKIQRLKPTFIEEERGLQSEEIFFQKC